MVSIPDVPVTADPTIPRSTITLLRDMAKPYWFRTASFFGLTFVGVAAWAAAPLVVSKIVTELSITHTVNTFVWVMAGLYIVFRVADEVLWRLGELIMRSVKPQMVEGVRWRLFAATLKRPYAFFVNSSSGRIGHWINQVTETTSTFIDLSVWSVWNQLAGLLISSIFLLATHWSLALLFVTWLVILFTYNIHRGKEFGRLVALVSDEESKASGLVVDALSNHVSVRAFGAEGTERRNLAEQQRQIIGRWRRSWRQNIVTNLVKGQSVAVVTTIALIMVIFLYAHGTIQLGAIVLFIAYFGDASTGLWELAWALDGYYRHFGTIQNALDGLQGEDERRVAGHALPAPSKQAVSLTLSDVSFAYPEQPDMPVLDHLDLEVAPHEKVGIVGHSGAGKSTLAGLLLGFYEPTTGTIAINGQSTFEHGPQLIRASSSFVPQDTSLFNRSVRDNVVYARPDANDEEIVAALAKAQAMEFVEKLPNGLASVIGERGVKLSGGQRQRIAIARAILQDAPLLILDEATSALDSISEQAIQKALFELMKDRTSIVIAHRLSTLKNLDRIIVIQNGRIAEQGSHQQLVRRGGVYADLWKRQKNGFVAG